MTFDRSCELSRRRKRADRRREVRVRTLMTGDELADCGQQIAEVPGVERADSRDPRLAELEDSETGSRAKYPRQFLERACRLRDVADAESDRRSIAGAVRHRDTGRIAANQSDARV